MGGLTGYLIAAGAVGLVWLATIVKAVLWAKASERNKQKAKEADAYEQHLKEIADAANARPTGSVSDDWRNRDNR